jgi:aspartate-semialdehyde dehydrogenase
MYSSKNQIKIEILAALKHKHLMKVAVVGATGLVGKKMMQVLEERGFSISEFYPVASEKSIGLPVSFSGKEYRVIEDMGRPVSLRPDIALFSAGGSTSKAWAPKFAEVGTVVIDNSSAWRMEPNIKLVVPEVNAGVIEKEHQARSSA